MTIHIKLNGALYAEILRDLSRRHPFAAERIGFVMGRIGSLSGDAKLILLNRYHPIPDSQYVRDRNVGARIGPQAMTAAMQLVYHVRPAREGIFHIHLHPHLGETRMSQVDARELPPLIPGFQSVGPDSAHGIIILSHNHGSGWVWLPGTQAPIAASSVSVVGVPIRVFERSLMS